MNTLICARLKVNLGGIMRKFEKISKDEFQKYFKIEEYDGFNLPRRATKSSAGYDFFAISDYVLHPGEKFLVPTGYKVKMESDEMLMIVIRSSMAIKRSIRVVNQVGIIESDYYNNESNEGHIFVSLENFGDEDFVLEKGVAYAQGIFTKFLVTDDDVALNKRTGGIGSTTK